MTTEERPPIDKRRWGDGPWQSEPDHAEFRHAGFVCLLHRNEMGAWCGYVGVPPGHPWHGQGYDDVGARVHGGLTYAAECNGSICHKPPPGEPEHLWWLGFDCAHSGDYVPGSGFRVHPHADWPRDEYRDISYGRAVTEHLAEQAAAAMERKA